MSTGNGTHSNKQPLFKFELGWFLREGFSEMVTQVWQNESRGITPLQKWQFKIQKVRQFLRGWAKNTSGTYKKEKEEIMKANELDKKAETHVLSAQEINLKQCLKQHLKRLNGIKEPRQLSCCRAIVIPNTSN
jgi:hypothetical protein